MPRIAIRFALIALLLAAIVPTATGIGVSAHRSAHARVGRRGHRGAPTRQDRGEGQAEGIVIYEWIARRDSATPDQLRTETLGEQSLNAYLARDFGGAVTAAALCFVSSRRRQRVRASSACRSFGGARGRAGLGRRDRAGRQASFPKRWRRRPLLSVRSELPCRLRDRSCAPSASRRRVRRRAASRSGSRDGECLRPRCRRDI